jgi:hypothetical protein
MKTTEIIDGKQVVIDWQFEEIQDRHDSNWCCWSVTGAGDDGKEYSGSCGADGSEPNDCHDEVIDIEEI